MVSSSPSASSRNSAVTGFLLGSGATLVAVWLTSRFSFRKNSERQSDNAEKGGSKQARGAFTEIPAEIREEQLSRHTLYFGENGMKSLKDSAIVVVGVGGVGSHVAHMLGRAGVGRIRLIDFDQVTVSSLNRHACATLADVGIPKVTCMKNFLEKICPDPTHLKVEAITEMYTQENGKRLLQFSRDNSMNTTAAAAAAGSNTQKQTERKWDIVIDAIDDVPTKAALLAHCLKDNIRVMSCMGAGGKSDVTRLHISDLRTASRDPLASKLRQHLKKMIPPDNKDKDNYLESMEKLAIIYSSEKPVVKLADFTAEQQAQGVHKFGAVDGMRIRVLPVLGTMPAIMGQTLAAMALCELGGKPMQPVTGERIGKNVRNRMFQHLKHREDTITRETLGGEEKKLTNEGLMMDGKWVGPIQIDQDDIGYLLEVWRNRCAVTGDRLGTVLELARWDTSKPSTCNNLVLMGAPALEKFDKPGGKEAIPESARRVIETRLASCNID